jgi:hypothetical protein
MAAREQHNHRAIMKQRQPNPNLKIKCVNKRPLITLVPDESSPSKQIVVKADVNTVSIPKYKIFIGSVSQFQRLVEETALTETTLDAVFVVAHELQLTASSIERDNSTLHVHWYDLYAGFSEITNEMVAHDIVNKMHEIRNDVSRDINVFICCHFGVDRAPDVTANILVIMGICEDYSTAMQLIDDNREKPPHV